MLDDERGWRVHFNELVRDARSRTGKGPVTPKRPRDTAQLAKYIVDVATGEQPNIKPKVADPKAVKRGEARAKHLTPERRSEIARSGAAAKWKKK